MKTIQTPTASQIQTLGHAAQNWDGISLDITAEQIEVRFGLYCYADLADFLGFVGDYDEEFAQELLDATGTAGLYEPTVRTVRWTLAQPEQPADLVQVSPVVEPHDVVVDGQHLGTVGLIDLGADEDGRTREYEVRLLGRTIGGLVKRDGEAFGTAEYVGAPTLGTDLIVDHDVNYVLADLVRIARRNWDTIDAYFAEAHADDGVLVFDEIDPVSTDFAVNVLGATVADDQQAEDTRTWDLKVVVPGTPIVGVGSYWDHDAAAPRTRIRIEEASTSALVALRDAIDAVLAERHLFGA